MQWDGIRAYTCSFASFADVRMFEMSAWEFFIRSRLICSKEEMKTTFKPLLLSIHALMVCGKSIAMGKRQYLKCN